MYSPVSVLTESDVPTIAPIPFVNIPAALPTTLPIGPKALPTVSNPVAIPPVIASVLPFPLEGINPLPKSNPALTTFPNLFN